MVLYVLYTLTASWVELYVLYILTAPCLVLYVLYAFTASWVELFVLYSLNCVVGGAVPALLFELRRGWSCTCSTF